GRERSCCRRHRSPRWGLRILRLDDADFAGPNPRHERRHVALDLLDRRLEEKLLDPQLLFLVAEPDELLRGGHQIEPASWQCYRTRCNRCPVNGEPPELALVYAFVLEGGGHVDFLSTRFRCSSLVTVHDVASNSTGGAILATSSFDK